MSTTRTTGARCASAPLVERHFAARISPADERQLRAHLPGCAACRSLYQRHLVLAGLDPAAPSAQDRLARGLGLARPSRSRWPAIGLVAAAAVALALILVQRPGAVPSPGYASRGGAGARIYLYRSGSDGVPVELAGDSVHTGDELAIAYSNPDARGHLLVFATDAQGRVYWYVPAWTDASSDPRGLAILAGAARHEIPQAVTHALPTGHLTLHALFTDHAFGVREVESMLTLAPGVLAHLGRPYLRVELEVVP